VHGRAEAEIPLFLPFKPVDVLQLVAPGTLLVKRDLGKAKRSDDYPPVITAARAVAQPVGTGVVIFTGMAT
jgi:hypothetical protein